ncbi:ATP-binding protein [Achromobacter mucicolens]|uniref:ATP-dependent nuclease n=1 Tax=Achromobacter mucicolens TaxID=1389922 RepID=UPI002448244A|nr:AAA family ATPase [Achromobacter mucicolens]MDH0091656.1 ATP-binding protein [Achromobacter mucicolens]
MRVQNFRSLAEADIELHDYTALVGLNDSGKSNLLRALNLFFNGHTDLDQPLVFENDFSQQARLIAKKAKQIEIEVEFTPPKNYRDADHVIWKKVYRADSTTPYLDQVYRKDGREFSRGSRTEYWIRHLAFEYVPAVRGKSFFSSLKRRLHATLADTVAPKLTGASTTFLSSLRAEVKKIEQDSHRLLQLKTEFSLPSDLGDLFEALEFNSADGHTKTALHYRGDGIQGRHVPLILKFLADQRKTNSAMGKPPSETIWGYEEPENNLELSKQIDMATEFATYASAVQILVSTHSPAFYNVARTSPNGGIQNTIRSNGRTDFSREISPEQVDKHLGLMPFVEPYLAKAKEEREQLIASVKELEATALVTNKPALYVEGCSDKTIIEAAISALGLKQNFVIVAKEGMGGGANWVASCCLSRAAMTDVTATTVALFDNDAAGKEAASNLLARCSAIGRDGRTSRIFIGSDNGEDHIRRIKSSGIKIPLSIDELCDHTAWLHAERKGWLETRGSDLIEANVALLELDQPPLESLNALLHQPHDLLVVHHKLKANKKGDFASYVGRRLSNEKVVPATLAALVRKIVMKFQD